jgi:serine phosphatase RsbU (regulator of sigma subunit)
VSVPGNDVSVTCEPWRDGRSGGDIYYMSNCMAGLISRFVLADVAGHGEASDELATSLRRLMRKHVNTADQSRFARALNREFGELSTMGRFATALITTYFAPTDHLIVCNAGHPAPLWYRAAESRWMLLRHDAPEAVRIRSGEDVGVPNLPLGILEPTSFHQFAVRLDRHDLVVMYTDALPEARLASGLMLGEDGLLELAAGLERYDTGSVSEQLLARVKSAAAAASLDDDATVLVLRHNAANPPRQSAVDRMRALGRMIGLH